MSSLNKATIIGHLGRDPETRYLPSGEAVTNFSVATSETWKDKQTGERKEATEWHRISTFGKLAEIAGEYLVKGSLVYIEGKINTRKYQDKNGVERYATEIRADTMKMLGAKPQQGQQENEGHRPAPAARPAAQSRPAPATSGGGFDDMDDDIPF